MVEDLRIMRDWQCGICTFHRDDRCHLIGALRFLAGH